MLAGKVLFKIILAPLEVPFIKNWQVPKPPPTSVAFAVIFMISFILMFVKDLFKLVFTTGGVVSGAEIKVNIVPFCFLLLELSIAIPVMFITVPAASLWK